jgi:hypothetical protein
MLCIGWPGPVIEDVSDGTLGEGGVVCCRRGAVVHVMNRVVRRCFLLGDDAVTGKNYDHRKQWIEDELQKLAGAMGIDLLGLSWWMRLLCQTIAMRANREDGETE